MDTGLPTLALSLADAAVGLLAAYAAFGALVALACLAIGPRAWAPVQGAMTWQARLLLVPGTLLLWPWLAWHWLAWHWLAWHWWARARRNR